MNKETSEMVKYDTTINIEEITDIDDVLSKYMESDTSKNIVRKILKSKNDGGFYTLIDFDFPKNVSNLFKNIDEVKLLNKERYTQFEVKTVDGTLIHSNEFIDLIKTYMKDKYNSDSFEMYFWFEGELIVLLPKFTNNIDRLTLFKKYVMANKDMIKMILTDEFDKGKQNDLTSKIKLGYIPIWCEQTDKDYFLKEKIQYLDNLQNKLNDKCLNMKNEKYKLLNLCKEIKETSKFEFITKNYKISSGHVRWVLASIRILDIIEVSSINESINEFIDKTYRSYK